MLSKLLYHIQIPQYPYSVMMPLVEWSCSVKDLPTANVPVHNTRIIRTQATSRVNSTLAATTASLARPGQRQQTVHVLHGENSVECPIYC